MSDKQKKSETKQEKAERKISLKREILDKMTTLATAAFGLVAALAWNEAIQSLFRVLFPNRDHLAAKFYYALVVTAIVVIVTLYLGRLSEKFKKQEEEITNE